MTPISRRKESVLRLPGSFFCAAASLRLLRHPADAISRKSRLADLDWLDWGGYPAWRRSRLRSRGVGVRDRKAGEFMSVIEPRKIARRPEPMFNAPLVVLGLILILVAIQAALNWEPDAVHDRILRDFGFAPIRLTSVMWPETLVDLKDRSNSDP